MAEQMNMSGQWFFCSWSGGKDSALSIYRAIKAGGIPAALLTMMTEGGERSRSHGLRLDVIRAQADAMGIPLVTRSATWATYEEVFREAVRQFATQGITAGVFGDIDLDEHRDWCVRVCREAAVRVGVQALHPLWKMDRMDVVRQFLDAGFQAYIVAMKDGLGRSGVGGDGVDWGKVQPGDVQPGRVQSGDATVDLLALLGQPFDRHVVDLVAANGVDACGEAGEFHTVVTDGPLFHRPLRLKFGGSLLRDGYWFVDGEIR